MTNKTTPNKMNPIVFCNIGWHSKYNGQDGELLLNGGAYVEEHGTGNEIMNYLPLFVTDEETGEEKPMLLGSYETKCTRGKVNQTHIEKIHGCELLKKEGYADGVTVVWCAKSPKGKTCVVGWYKNATVCRYYDDVEIETVNKGFEVRVYNVYGAYEDAVLLPEEERYNPKWHIPRSKENPLSFGFGQANIWYASEPNAKEFVKQMIQNIDTYNGEDAKTKAI